MMMSPARTVRNPWWWLGVLAVLLIGIGLTGRLGLVLAAVLVPDALKPDQSEQEGK